MTLRWQPSASDGGAPIKQYIIEKKETSKNNWIACGRVDPGTPPIIPLSVHFFWLIISVHFTLNIFPDKSSYRVSKLWEGCEYNFRVYAENSVGAGESCTLEKPVEAKLPYCKFKPSQSFKEYETDFNNFWINLFDLKCRPVNHRISKLVTSRSEGHSSLGKPRTVMVDRWFRDISSKRRHLSAKGNALPANSDRSTEVSIRYLSEL